MRFPCRARARRRKQAGGIAALALLASLATPAFAQSGAAFGVGTIASDRTCTVYQQSAGRSGAVLTPWAVGSYASWRTWLVKDCVSNFASMKLSLQAALAAGGGVGARSGGGKFTISGRVSAVDGGGARPAPEAPDGQAFAIASNLITVNMDVTVRDAAGHIVFGGLLTKTLEVGSDIKAGTFRATGNMSGAAAYTRLQHEVALAVARMVVFHFDPLRIVGGSGRIARLNHGAPLLALGTLAQGIGGDGQPVMLRVIAAGAGSASAEIKGDGDLGDLAPDSSLTVIEADDPAANQQTLRRVDLP